MPRAGRGERPAHPRATSTWRRGTRTRDQLLAAFPEALLVTELIGQGVNGVTGDYSRGAAGFMVRGGAIAEPVAEITIASNLIDMFATLEPGSDLEFRRGVDAPTLLVPEMTVERHRQQTGRNEILLRAAVALADRPEDMGDDLVAVAQVLEENVRTALAVLVDRAAPFGRAVTEPAALCGGALPTSRMPKLVDAVRS